MKLASTNGKRPAIPHNPDAEIAAIGAMLMSDEARDIGLSTLSPEDFYAPEWATIFAAIESLHRTGRAIDAVTVSAECDRLGRPDLKRAYLDAMFDKGLPWSIDQYCQEIIDAAGRRRILDYALKVADMARENTAPAEQLMQVARKMLGEIDFVPLTDAPSGLSTMAEFLEEAEDDVPWLIPGIIKAKWRILIVGGEGAGKSTVLRTVGVAAAAGKHPFTHRPVAPVRSLIVDIENPDEAIKEMCGPMHLEAESVPDFDPDRCWLWRQEGGIDLLSRRDMASLELAIRAARPDVLCIGPVYKMFDIPPGQNEDGAVKLMLKFLDDIRVRYDLGLVMEAHAPHGSEMRPYGASIWKRWTEMGISMIPVEGQDGTYRLGRFRGDRVKNNWPDRIERSGAAWPWTGYWAAGMDTFDRRPVSQDEGPGYERF